jgi:outer membrane lipoprotein SlyB
MRFVKPLALLTAVILAGCQARTDSSSSTATAKPGTAREAASRPAPKAAAEAPLLAIGTVLPVQLETSLSSATSHEGDLIVARLSEDVKAGEKVVLKEGTEVRGRVVAAVPSGRVKGRARLAIDFDRILAGGKEREASLRAIDITAPSGKGKDAKVIGGSAGVGLIIGAIADGGKGAAIGTAVGAAAGTGAVLATRGKQVQLPAGSALKLRVEREARL